MNKISTFLLLFFGMIVSAQPAILTGGSWSITKIKYQNQIYNFSAPSLPPPMTSNNYTTFSPTTLRTELFNTFTGTLSDITQNSFTLHSFGSTLIQCPDPQFEQFENYYANIFNQPSLPQVFQYTITEIPPYTFELIVTHPITGNQVFYITHILSASSQPIRKAIFHPNPVTDILTIENLEKTSLVSIFDSTGKKVHVAVNNGLNQLKISTKHLPEGIYYIKINEEKMMKFLKK